MTTITEEIDLRRWARDRVRDRKRARRLKWLNRCLVPVCIVVLALFVRAALQANMYEAFAGFSIVGLLCLFAWRSK